MNVMRWGASMIQRTSPAGLILLGAGLALTLPPVRRGLRSSAVAAIRGVMTVSESVQETLSGMREGMENIVSEARGSDGLDDQPCTFLEAARTHGRRAAVAVAGGAMAARDEWKSIISEARDARAGDEDIHDEIRVLIEEDAVDTVRHSAELDVSEGAQVVEDGLDPDIEDIGPDASNPKRPRVKTH